MIHRSRRTDDRTWQLHSCDSMSALDDQSIHGRTRYYSVSTKREKSGVQHLLKRRFIRLENDSQAGWRNQLVTVRTRHPQLNPTCRLASILVAAGAGVIKVNAYSSESSADLKGQRWRLENK